MKIVGKRVTRKDGKSYTAYFKVGADGKKKRVTKEVAMRLKGKKPASKKRGRKAASCTQKYKKCVAAKKAPAKRKRSKCSKCGKVGHNKTTCGRKK